MVSAVKLATSGAVNYGAGDGIRTHDVLLGQQAPHLVDLSFGLPDLLHL